MAQAHLRIAHAAPAVARDDRHDETVDRSRTARWVVAIALAIAAAFAVATLLVALFIDEPLRREMERQLNATLTGYRVHIGRLAFHPVGFSLDLEDAVILQRPHPNPPVVRLPRLHASVHWRALLHGRLVADFLFERPVINIDRRQAEQEASDDVRLADRGWQKAAEEIYPLKIDLLRVVDGEVTYTDRGPVEPLHATRVNFRADNIRNARSREREYPSDLHLDAVVFGTGTVSADGHADFLAEPFAGLDTFFHLDALPLRPFTAVLQRYAAIRRGTLSAAGELEYSPRIGRADLKDVTLDGVEADYIRTAENAAAEERGTEKAVAAARAVSNAPSIRLHAEQLRIRHGTLGVVDRSHDPSYRLFLDNIDLTLKHLSNQRAEGPSFAQLRGRFMGSGDTDLRARFHPETKAPNFDVDLRIEHTDLRSLEDVLRAHTGTDIAAGDFSLYSSLRVRDLTVDGYVKPVLKDVRVYEAGQDRDKPFLHRLYERSVGIVATLLESRERHEIATRADVSGPLTAPHTSRWQILTGLLRNAFISAITPGLDDPARVPDRPVASRERRPL